MTSLLFEPNANNILNKEKLKFLDQKGRALLIILVVAAIDDETIIHQTSPNSLPRTEHY